MPFGPNCEYADFAECVSENQGRDNPEAYCGALQRRTEGHCDVANRLKHRNLIEIPQIVARRTSARPTAQLRKGRNNWYDIKNKASDTAEVYIYDEIGYWGTTAADFVRDLRDISAKNIDLHLNSPGGEVFDAIAIYNALVQHDANVNTIIDSLAASAASFIAMAGSTVTIAKNATMMIHDAMGLTIGNAADMREMAEALDKMSDNIASIYADHAGGEIADWREAMKAETWYNAEEAMSAGLADEIYGQQSQGSGEEENSWDLSIFQYAGREKAPTPVIPEKFDFDIDTITNALKGAFV